MYSGGQKVQKLSTPNFRSQSTKSPFTSVRATQLTSHTRLPRKPVIGGANPNRVPRLLSKPKPLTSPPSKIKTSPSNLAPNENSLIKPIYRQQLKHPVTSKRPITVADSLARKKNEAEVITITSQPLKNDAIFAKVNGTNNTTTSILVLEKPGKEIPAVLTPPPTDTYYNPALFTFDFSTKAPIFFETATGNASASSISSIATASSRHAVIMQSSYSHVNIKSGKATPADKAAPVKKLQNI